MFTKPQPMQMKSQHDYEKIKDHGRASLFRKRCNQGLWYALRHPAAQEAFASRIYRLLTDQYQPRYNQLTPSTSLSQAIPGFIEVGKLNDEYQRMAGAVELRDAKLGQHYAAGAAVGDRDPHGLNFAFDKEGHLIRIDLEFSGKPPAAYYLLDIPTTIDRLLRFDSYTHTGHLNYWPADVVGQMGGDVIYRQDVLYTLIFFSLLNRNIFQQMALDNFPSDEADEPVEFMEKRRVAFRSQLAKIPETKSFLEQQGDRAIAAIVERIEEVNEESRRKIQKFNHRIALFKEHKADFDTLGEYQYLTRKERYRGLGYAQMLKMFDKRIQMYQSRLIEVKQITESYALLSQELKLVRTTPSSIPFFAKAKVQKQLMNLKQRYDETHPMGSVSALADYLNDVSPLEEKEVNSLVGRIHKIITNMHPFSCNEEKAASEPLIEDLLNLAVYIDEKHMPVPAVKLVLCVIHLTPYPFISNIEKRNKFINLLLRAAKEANMEKPLEVAYRLVENPEALEKRINELGLQDMRRRVMSNNPRQRC